MDPLMDESFFIEDPEKLENNFFNQEIKKEFNENFREKSHQIITETSKKARYQKKMKKKMIKNNTQMSYTKK